MNLKPIKGLEGIYAVSDRGEVYSVKRGIFLKPEPVGDDGHIRYTLMIDKKRKRVFAHRLVAEHFVKNPHHALQVRHLDGDKRNNKATNLVWGSSKKMR